MDTIFEGHLALGLSVWFQVRSWLPVGNKRTSFIWGSYRYCFECTRSRRCGHQRDDVVPLLPARHGRRTLRKLWSESNPNAACWAIETCTRYKYRTFSTFLGGSMWSVIVRHRCLEEILVNFRRYGFDPRLGWLLSLREGHPANEK